MVAATGLKRIKTKRQKQHWQDNQQQCQVVLLMLEELLLLLLSSLLWSSLAQNGD
jgi:hypothetical protein